jgi:hypothetical protein
MLRQWEPVTASDIERVLVKRRRHLHRTTFAIIAMFVFAVFA